MSYVEEELAERFVCAKCGSEAGKVKTLAMTGAGVTRFFDIQANRYIFVSCDNCGYTEVFDAEVLKGTDTLGTVLDAIFSGR
ncbi:MAG: zinc ribbon domain-containing protein [Anaerolineae bacterium]